MQKGPEVALIFGYGSLMSSTNRKMTGETRTPCPVVLTGGVERRWNIHFDDGGGMTALGIVDGKLADVRRSVCNGVVLPIPVDQLPLFDKREDGYHRIHLPRSGVTSVESFELPDGEIYAYALDGAETPPTAANPLIQSYIDVVASGCLEYGDGFARMFVQNTVGWNGPWLNDREIKPRYVRAMEETPLAANIDRLFEELLPTQYSERLVPVPNRLPNRLPERLRAGA